MCLCCMWLKWQLGSAGNVPVLCVAIMAVEFCRQCACAVFGYCGSWVLPAMCLCCVWLLWQLGSAGNVPVLCVAMWQWGSAGNVPVLRVAISACRLVGCTECLKTHVHLILRPASCNRVTYPCAGLRCGNFTMQCENDGFVSVVDDQCSCLCPPGLDPATGCTKTVTQGRILCLCLRGVSTWPGPCHWLYCHCHTG